MTQRRIDYEIIKATNELKADVTLIRKIASGDENTVVEVSPSNSVRSPKKMVEDTYKETKKEIEDRFGSLDKAVKKATEQADKSEQSRQASNKSASNASASEKAAAASETNAKNSETRSKESETQANKSKQEANGSASSAKTSETKSDEYRKAAASSDKSAQAARNDSISAKDIAVQEKEESIKSRELARKWATEKENIPVQDGEYSALHWSKLAERIADTMTNGMYFAGSWDFGWGLPPHLGDNLVPWYRLTGTNISSLSSPDSVLSKLAKQANKGDQLVWDPIKREWFVLDTADKVWLVNGQQGEVVLNSKDVGAYPQSGGSIDGNILFKKGQGITLDQANQIRSGLRTDSLLIIGGNASKEIRIVSEKVVVTSNINKNGGEIYHENNKPSPNDIGAMSVNESNHTTGNLSIGKENYFRCLSISRGNMKARFSNGLTSATITYIEDNTEISILTLKETLRVKEKNDSNYHRIYHENFKPSALEIGAEPKLDADRKRKITISTNEPEPSGGDDGDIWFKVEP